MRRDEETKGEVERSRDLQKERERRERGERRSGCLRRSLPSCKCTEHVLSCTTSLASSSSSSSFLFFLLFLVFASSPLLLLPGGRTDGRAGSCRGYGSGRGKRVPHVFARRPAHAKERRRKRRKTYYLYVPLVLYYKRRPGLLVSTLTVLKSLHESYLISSDIPYPVSNSPKLISTTLSAWPSSRVSPRPSRAASRRCCVLGKCSTYQSTGTTT